MFLILHPTSAKRNKKKTCSKVKGMQSVFFKLLVPHLRSAGDVLTMLWVCKASRMAVLRGESADDFWRTQTWIWSVCKGGQQQSVNGQGVNGHGVNGQGVNGHDVNGHGVNGQDVNGQDGKSWCTVVKVEASVGCDFVDGPDGLFRPIDKFRSACVAKLDGMLDLFITEESHAYHPAAVRCFVASGNEQALYGLGTRFYVIAARDDLILTQGWWAPECEYFVLFASGKEIGRLDLRKELGHMESSTQGNRAGAVDDE